MTKISTCFTVLIIPALFIACKKNANDTTPVSNWVRRADFDGIARSRSVAMVINDTAYVGTGTDDKQYMKDIWRYDPDNNNWSQRADLPGDGRAGAIAFAIATKGYLGTGYNQSGSLKDIWQYNPVGNQWTRKQDFAGTARYGAVAFAIKNKGYITTGFDGTDLNDLYEYNPDADTTGAATSSWTAKQNMSGTKRSGAIAFVYQDKAYLCTGGTGTGTSFVPATDMWVYDPATGNWTQKRAIINASLETYDDAYMLTRRNAAAFVMNNHGYISTGENAAVSKNASALRDTWQYDFVTDLWVKLTNFEGVERSNAVGFAVKDRGFVAGGSNAVYFFSDMREFFPSMPYNVND